MSADVRIYTSPWCGYCTAAKRLLHKKGARYEEVDVLAAPERRQEMEAASGRHTVPQIFINGRSIGGYDDLAALDARNELDPLLDTPGASA